MSKAVLIIIALIIVVVIFFGLFYFLGSPAKKNSGTIGKTVEVEGVKITTTQEGSGDSAVANDRVLMHYHGYLGTEVGGTKFDSSYDKNAPFLFVLGNNQVIRGWEIGVLGMKVGEKRVLVIPPELGYGAGGYPPIIPQNSWLTFEVEMLEIK